MSGTLRDGSSVGPPGRVESTFSFAIVISGKLINFQWAARILRRIRARTKMATMFRVKVSSNNASTVAYNSGRVFSMSGDCVDKIKNVIAQIHELVGQ